MPANNVTNRDARSDPAIDLPTLHRVSANNIATSGQDDNKHNEHRDETAFDTVALGAQHPSFTEDGLRYQLKATDPGVMEQLGFGFPFKKKWRILCIIFLIQVSMNLNTTLYSSGIAGMSEEFHISTQTATWGAAVFLLAYAFGCEFWAPWSEEYGRKWVLRLSMLLVNLFGIWAALATSFNQVIAARVLGGLSTAGGSVTLAVVADLFDHDDPWYQKATLFIVASSVGGSIIGPIIGAPMEEYLHWRWCMHVQYIFGIFTLGIHWFFVPETRATVLLDKAAKEMRSAGMNVYGPGELAVEYKRLDWRELCTIWARPFRFFVTEPIVLVLSLLSGFSDALIFMFVQSFPFIYRERWHLDTIQMSSTFVPLFIGYVIAYFSFLPAIKRNIRERKEKPNCERAQYEARLWWLLYMAPLLPLGLLIFALTATMPGVTVHWIGSMVATCLIGIANFAIYMATIDYMLRAYGPYAASATGGNGWARDFLAGVLTPAAVPMYENLGAFPATWLLFGIAVLLTIAVYFVYRRGAYLRHRSNFAQSLAAEESRNEGGLVNFLPSVPGSRAVSIRDTSLHSPVMRSPVQSPYATPVVSRPNSPVRPGLGSRGISWSSLPAPSLLMSPVNPRPRSQVATPTVSPLGSRTNLAQTRNNASPKFGSDELSTS
ncbi:hypothetical protein DL766_005619 [Monosporascus sp. MC13-8B]|uniref:Major facilitator superfamily (MFS) profile domain-containing protein n=1 Tax=Monosporascus cannonballus TaxID=155416 RepID=A0ABY0GRR4_9PEZI|nr:hypothetical protein DL762_010062 [Monosporascus cannonballus]RYO76753.1 hypothetical protein DL763_010140 [Monosporascus cannonballus]RYP28917.1 hypothetical protein DL766_005619 [Monosporascus sp. MC13-8B]